MADEAIKRLIELGINAQPAVEELERLRKETEKNTRSVDDLGARLDKFGKSIKDAIGAAAILEIGRMVVGAAMSMVDALDELNKKSQALGMPVEELQEWEYAADLAGVSSEQLTTALTSLNDKVAQIDTATGAASNILKHFGVTAGEETGSALKKIADGFAAAADGPTKTAIAVELFGKKLGGKMIPLLNAGSAGFEELAEEARKAGLIIGSDTTKAAEEFNDNLTRLQKNLTAFGAGLLKDVLPPLVTLTNLLVANIKELGVWAGVMQTINDAVFGTQREQLARDALAAQERMDKLTARLNGLNEAARAQWGPVLSQQIAAAESDFKRLNGQLTELQKKQDAAAIAARKAQEAAAAAGKDAGKPQLPAGLLATGDTGKGKGKKAEVSELDKWTESLKKLQEQADLAPEKLKRLQAMVDAMRGTAAEATPGFAALVAELEKMKADPVAAALKKVDEAIKALATNKAVLQGLADELERMKQAGEGASERAKVLEKTVLEMSAAAGDAEARVLLRLQETEAARKKQQDDLTALYALYGRGAIQFEAFETEKARLLGESTKQVQVQTDHVKQLSDSLGDFSARFIGDFIDELIDGMGRAETSFADMVESFLKQLAKLLASQEMAKLATELSSMFGGMFGSGEPVRLGAQGMAFASPNVRAFAAGGILSGPTLFSMGAQRLGLAGEAGPEAVVPLQRTSGGDLGVGASPVTVNILNKSDANVTEQHHDNADGERVIDILIERKVRGMVADGSLDRGMRSAYGVSRQPAMG